MLAAWLLLFWPNQVEAIDGQVLGVHILNPSEITQAEELIRPEDDDTWRYVTVPLSLNDLSKQEEWQNFFKSASEKKIIPIVRLVTRFENGSWQVPNRKEVVSLIDFLNQLTWPTSERYVIVFNEPNHSNEWGGQLDPKSYTQTLTFTSAWAHATSSNFKVLPAALDLAASSGGQTMEAFNYLNQMLAVNPDVFSTVDYWNSHSYPNPAFSASPQKTGQNSLRGFQYELDFLKQKTGRDYQVFITETGWSDNAATHRWLTSYYQYAVQNIWSDSRVIAVTPFLLQGDPGPFTPFSFIDKTGQPTHQYAAYQDAIRKIKGT